ncbi:MAG: cyclic nucleotide-binding domain-containing protein, partial [Candidatus Omnitrophica bacterium]|nr:cyclic nucleotide-binding domain-containing protein [Candidatus Omnitrophota bacterium]
ISDDIYRDNMFFFWDEKGYPKVDYFLHEAGITKTHTPLKSLTDLSPSVKSRMDIVHLRTKDVPYGLSKPKYLGTKTFIAPARPEEYYANVLSMTSLLGGREKAGEILKKGKVVSFGPGEEVIIEGSKINFISNDSTAEIRGHKKGEPCFYIMLSGRAEVLVGGQKVCELSVPGWFGEWALETKEKRSATIKAKTKMMCLEVNFETYKNLVRTKEFLDKEVFLKDNILLIEKWLTDLGVPRLTNLVDFVYENMAGAVEPRTYENGKTIITEGEKGDEAYLIKSGTVKVMLKDGTVVRRGEGELIGEMALLSEDGKRTATVTAGEPGGVEVLVIKKDTFLRMIRNCPALYKAVAEKIEERYRALAESYLRVSPEESAPDSAAFRALVRLKSSRENLPMPEMVERLKKERFLDIRYGGEGTLLNELRSFGFDNAFGMDLASSGQEGRAKPDVVFAPFDTENLNPKAISKSACPALGVRSALPTETEVSIRVLMRSRKFLRFKRLLSSTFFITPFSDMRAKVSSICFSATTSNSADLSSDLRVLRYILTFLSAAPSVKQYVSPLRISRADTSIFLSPSGVC